MTLKIPSPSTLITTKPSGLMFTSLTLPILGNNFSLFVIPFSSNSSLSSYLKLRDPTSKLSFQFGYLSELTIAIPDGAIDGIQ